MLTQVFATLRRGRGGKERKGKKKTGERISLLFSSAYHAGGHERHRLFSSLFSRRRQGQEKEGRKRPSFISRTSEVCGTRADPAGIEKKRPHSGPQKKKGERARSTQEADRSHDHFLSQLMRRARKKKKEVGGENLF